jgi:excisionase family DNA binding protein
VRSRSTTDPIEPPLLDKRAVAARLHVHEQTVLEWAREGTIECIRLGFRTIRFTEEHVSRFLARAAQRNIPRRKRINGARKRQPVRSPLASRTGRMQTDEEGAS